MWPWAGHMHAGRRLPLPISTFSIQIIKVLVQLALPTPDPTRDGARRDFGFYPTQTRASRCGHGTEVKRKKKKKQGGGQASH